MATNGPNPRPTVEKTKRIQAQRAALRTRINGEKCIAGVYDVIEKADAAYLMGDKDSVPALKLRFDGYMALLNKVLPTPRTVELTQNSNTGPVLILDMVGAQPFIKPHLNVIDGELVDATNAKLEATSRGESGATSKPDGDSEASLFD